MDSNTYTFNSDFFNQNKDHSPLDIIGENIEMNGDTLSPQGWQALSELLSIYSDKRYETARIIFINENGKIVDQITYADRYPDRTMPYPSGKSIFSYKEYAKNTGAKIVFCHNHPSGNPEPSQADIYFTDVLHKFLDADANLFAGHIIIDHGSASYYQPVQKNWYKIDDIEKTDERKFYQDIIGSYAGNNPYETAIKILQKIDDKEKWNMEGYIPAVFVRENNICESMHLFEEKDFQDKQLLLQKIQTIALNFGATKLYLFPATAEHNNLCVDFDKTFNIVADIFCQDEKINPRASKDYIYTENEKKDSSLKKRIFSVKFSAHLPEMTDTRYMDKNAVFDRLVFKQEKNIPKKTYETLSLSMEKNKDMSYNIDNFVLENNQTSSLNETASIDYDLSQVIDLKYGANHMFNKNIVSLKDLSQEQEQLRQSLFEEIHFPNTTGNTSDYSNISRFFDFANHEDERLIFLQCAKNAGNSVINGLYGYCRIVEEYLRIKSGLTPLYKDGNIERPSDDIREKESKINNYINLFAQDIVSGNIEGLDTKRISTFPMLEKRLAELKENREPETKVEFEKKCIERLNSFVEENPFDNAERSEWNEINSNPAIKNNILGDIYTAIDRYDLQPNYKSIYHLCSDIKNHMDTEWNSIIASGNVEKSKDFMNLHGSVMHFINFYEREYFVQNDSHNIAEYTNIASYFNFDENPDLYYLYLKEIKNIGDSYFQQNGERNVVTNMLLNLIGEKDAWGKSASENYSKDFADKTTICTDLAYKILNGEVPELKNGEQYIKINKVEDLKSYIASDPKRTNKSVGGWGTDSEDELLEQNKDSKNLNVDLSKVIVFDTETTGLNAGDDELLQISIIDGNGKTIFNKYVKPEHKKSWPFAEKVNGISPKLVKNCPSVKDYIPELQKIFDGAELFVSYNGRFDVNFLEAAGVKVPENTPHLDVIKPAASITKFPAKENDKRAVDGYHYPKLTDVSEAINFSYKAHDSLGDTTATLEVAKHIYGKNLEKLTLEDALKYGIDKVKEKPKTKELNTKKETKVESVEIKIPADFQKVTGDVYTLGFLVRTKHPEIVSEFLEKPENHEYRNLFELLEKNPKIKGVKTVLNSKLGEYSDNNHPELKTELEEYLNTRNYKTNQQKKDEIPYVNQIIDKIEAAGINVEISAEKIHEILKLRKNINKMTVDVREFDEKKNNIENKRKNTPKISDENKALVREQEFIDFQTSLIACKKYIEDLPDCKLPDIKWPENKEPNLSLSIHIQKESGHIVLTTINNTLVYDFESKEIEDEYLFNTFKDFNADNNCCDVLVKAINDNLGKQLGKQRSKLKKLMQENAVLSGKSLNELSEEDTKELKEKLKELDYEKIEGILVHKDKKIAVTPDVYVNEIMNAKLLVDHNHSVYLLPENFAFKRKNESGQNESYSTPDTLTDNEFVEFKTTKNNLGKRFGEAVEQANNILIRIQDDISFHKAQRRLQNKIENLHKDTGVELKNGKLFLYFEKRGQYVEAEIKQGKINILPAVSKLADFSVVPPTDDILSQAEELSSSIPKINQYLLKNRLIAGIAFGNNMVLHPDYLSTESAVHEYTHFWDAYTQKTNPELWNKGLELFKKTKYWNEVISDPNYQNIKDDENLVLSEIHSRICGDIAEKVLNRIAELDGEQVKLEAIKWDKEVMEYCKNEFGYENKDLSDFVSMTIKDLINEKNILEQNNIEEEKTMADEENLKKEDEFDELAAETDAINESEDLKKLKQITLDKLNVRNLILNENLSLTIDDMSKKELTDFIEETNKIEDTNSFEYHGVKLVCAKNEDNTVNIFEPSYEHIIAENLTADVDYKTQLDEMCKDNIICKRIGNYIPQVMVDIAEQEKELKNKSYNTKFGEIVEKFKEKCKEIKQKAKDEKWLSKSIFVSMYMLRIVSSFNTGDISAEDYNHAIDKTSVGYEQQFEPEAQDSALKINGMIINFGIPSENHSITIDTPDINDAGNGETSIAEIVTESTISSEAIADTGEPSVQETASVAMADNIQESDTITQEVESTTVAESNTDTSIPTVESESSTALEKFQKSLYDDAVKAVLTEHPAINTESKEFSNEVQNTMRSIAGNLSHRVADERSSLKMYSDNFGMMTLGMMDTLEANGYSEIDAYDIADFVDNIVENRNIPIDLDGIASIGSSEPENTTGLIAENTLNSLADKVRNITSESKYMFDDSGEVQSENQTDSFHTGANVSGLAMTDEDTESVPTEQDLEDLVASINEDVTQLEQLEEQLKIKDDTIRYEKVFNNSLNSDGYEDETTFYSRSYDGNKVKRTLYEKAVKDVSEKHPKLDTDSEKFEKEVSKTITKMCKNIVNGKNDDRLPEFKNGKLIDKYTLFGGEKYKSVSVSKNSIRVLIEDTIRFDNNYNIHGKEALDYLRDVANKKISPDLNPPAASDENTLKTDFTALQNGLQEKISKAEAMKAKIKAINAEKEIKTPDVQETNVSELNDTTIEQKSDMSGFQIGEKVNFEEQAAADSKSIPNVPLNKNVSVEEGLILEVNDEKERKKNEAELQKSDKTDGNNIKNSETSQAEEKTAAGQKEDVVFEKDIVPESQEFGSDTNITLESGIEENIEKNEVDLEPHVNIYDKEGNFIERATGEVNFMEIETPLQENNANNPVNEFFKKAFCCKTPEEYEKFYNEKYNFNKWTYKKDDESKLYSFYDENGVVKLTSSFADKEKYINNLINNNSDFFIPSPDEIKEKGLNVLKDSYNNFLKESGYKTYYRNFSTDPHVQECFDRINIDRIKEFSDTPYRKGITVPDFCMTVQVNGKAVLNNLSGYSYESMNFEKGTVILSKKDELGQIQYKQIDSDTYNFIVNRNKEISDAWDEKLSDKELLNKIETYCDNVGASKNQTRSNTAYNFWYNFKVLCEREGSNEFDAMKIAERIYTQMSPEEQQKIRTQEIEYRKETGLEFSDRLIKKFNQIMKEKAQSIKIQEQNSDKLIGEFQQDGSYKYYMPVKTTVDGQEVIIKKYMDNNYNPVKYDGINHIDGKQYGESLVNKAGVEYLRGKIDDSINVKVGDTIKYMGIKVAKFPDSKKFFSKKEKVLPLAEYKIQSASKDLCMITLTNTETGSTYELNLDEFIKIRKQVERKMEKVQKKEVKKQEKLYSADDSFGR